MSDASIARVNEPFIVAKGTVRKQFLATTQGQAACAGNYGKGRDRNNDSADLETNRFVWVSIKTRLLYRRVNFFFYNVYTTMTSNGLRVLRADTCQIAGILLTCWAFLGCLVLGQTITPPEPILWSPPDVLTVATLRLVLHRVCDWFLLPNLSIVCMDHFFATVTTYGGNHSSRGGIARRGHAGAADYHISTCPNCAECYPNMQARNSIDEEGHGRKLEARQPGTWVCFLYASSFQFEYDPTLMQR
jgi:hypothetical protein